MELNLCHYRYVATLLFHIVDHAITRVLRSDIRRYGLFEVHRDDQ